jgi:hypothetical protein
VISMDPVVCLFLVFEEISILLFIVVALIYIPINNV